MSDDYLRKMSLPEFCEQYEGTLAEPEPKRRRAMSGRVTFEEVVSLRTRLVDAETRVEQLATALKMYGYRRHYTCEDAFYSCPKSGERYDTVEGVEQVCTCGADQHNAKVDGVLAAFGPPPAREEGVTTDAL